MTATAVAATIPDPSVFKSEREFSAWLELTRRQSSSGGKEKLGGTVKLGDGYIRTLLVTGATAVIDMRRSRGWQRPHGSASFLEKKPAPVVAIALANKMARIAWAIMVTKQSYCMIPA